MTNERATASGRPMIERLLAADDALGRGELEVADRIFGQVAEADPRNAIAFVGLARIAVRRRDIEAARAALHRALDIDPDEAAAQRLLAELDSGSPREVAPRSAAAPGVLPRSAPPEPTAAPVVAASPVTAAAPQAVPARRPSILDRIRRWLGLSSDRG